jgi:hypothetical protein
MNSVDGQIKVKPNNQLVLLGPGKGIVLTAPNHTCWLLTVDNDGNLVTKFVMCPK